LDDRQAFRTISTAVQKEVWASSIMNISVIGSGYVGLTTALGLATKGHRVTCIDIDQNKVDMINRGEPPFYQDGLEEVLTTQVKGTGNLKASLDHDHLLHCDVTFICVNTSCNGGKNADFAPVRETAATIGRKLTRKDSYHVVVTKSSVPPGTTDEVIIPLVEEHSGKRVGTHFGMAVNPEFLQEDRALDSFLNSDRIVVGQYDTRSGDTLHDIYSGFIAPKLRTRIRTAEMIKFASNAFLATRVSFINEIGNLCKKLDIDVYEVAEGMGYDPRIGKRYLDAGVGFGGSCLPKDLEALLHKYESVGERSPLLAAVYEVNRCQPQRLVEIAQTKLGNLMGRRITVLGLAFKPQTDDIRHAPALEVIALLLRNESLVTVYDPRAMSAVRHYYPDIVYANSAHEAVDGSDCVMIVTDWPEFKNERLYRGKLVIDGRRSLDPEKAKVACSCYEGVCW